ncbi:MAG: 1-deoxy-D-xylulose-5-phosphate reductoisomerase [Phycisphaerae bacterium]|nr:1-deoxy-D-xylulose-5-phosphate reductoisomerase [Phycisphaerae bacterium]
MDPKRIAILGSTGSIGRQALEVISSIADLSACALAAGSNWTLLAEQAQQFRPQVVAIADHIAAEQLRNRLPDGAELLVGPEAMTELVSASRPDVLLSGVVGSAGLKPTLAGIDCGATLAIANKETLVMAGQIIIPAARDAHVPVLPVDSEHSAILQCLLAGRREEVRRVTITASGGALRDHNDAQAADATLEEALNHPTWKMGRKITIDSATLINKALEVVEAHWLFDLGPDQIEVVLHPESIVHACVEFCDGSVIAQLALPDMALPIAYALCFPVRPARGVEPLDLSQLGGLNFRKLPDRFARAVNLGYEAIRRGGLAGAVLNSANEAAVEAFCAGRIGFGRIVPIVEDILIRTPKTDVVTVESLIEANQWARGQVARSIDPAQNAQSSAAQPTGRTKQS